MKYAIIADNGRKQVKIVSDDRITLTITEGTRYKYRLALENGKLYNLATTDDNNIQELEQG